VLADTTQSGKLFHVFTILTLTLTLTLILVPHSPVILNTSGDVGDAGDAGELVECFGGGRHGAAKPSLISSTSATPVIVNY